MWFKFTTWKSLPPGKEGKGHQPALWHWRYPARDRCHCKQVRQVMWVHLAVEQVPSRGGADSAWVLPLLHLDDVGAWHAQWSLLWEPSRISGVPAWCGWYHLADVGIGVWPHGISCSRRIASSSQPRPSAWCIAHQVMKGAGFSWEQASMAGSCCDAWR